MQINFSVEFFQSIERNFNFFPNLCISMESEESTKLKIDKFLHFTLCMHQKFRYKHREGKVESFSLIKIESSEMETNEYI